MSFSSLGLSKEILEALKLKGYQKPTAIQKELIPAILSGRDILAGAETGTGKTAGFVLPLLHQIIQKQISREQGSAERPREHSLRVLILAPTRELAMQISEQITQYGHFLPLKNMVVYGGSPVAAQAKRMARGIDILTGTPGRIWEHLERKNLDLRSVDYLVLDEADRILDMGFVSEVSRIVQSLRPDVQKILITATLTGSVKTLGQSILRKPLSIETASMKKKPLSLRQVLHPVEKEKKLELLSYLIGSRNYRRVMVFVRTKKEADSVAEALQDSGLETAVIHGDKTPGARRRALDAFREERVRVLVATDIAARGLDIKALDIVVNYDIPHVAEDFIHRIGRTGRAGREGLAITLSSPEESVALQSIERLLGGALTVEEIPGYAPPRLPEHQGARKKAATTKGKTAGAFGHKKSVGIGKKRKTTKRDGYKASSSIAKKKKWR